MKRTIIALVGLALFGAFVVSCSKKEEETPKVVLKAPWISAEMDGEAAVVSWKAVTNATSYTVECKKAAESNFAVATTVTYSPASINSLDFGNTYEFRVKATCGDSESPYSNVVSLEVVRYLSKPVVAASAGLSSIEVEWDTVEGAATYQLEHKLSLDNDYTVDYTGDGADIHNKYIIEGLESGKSYDVRVGAVAEGYSMSYSEVATIATTQAPSVFISTADQLIEWLGSVSSETDYVAALANDIDMSDKTITSASGFSGTFDGQGFAIKNLVSSVPLFAENGGRIKNLNFDSSCSFTPAQTVTEFGALAALDNGGIYMNVNTAASITITATGDITNNIALGGLVGASNSSGGSTFDHCSNSGAITLDAKEYTHWAVAMAGIVGWTRKSTLNYCTNSGPISLYAQYGDGYSHQWSFISDETTDTDGNISVAGIVGRALDHEQTTDVKSSYDHCENLTGGAITLNHSHMDALPKVDKTGCLNVAGICGQSNGTMESCVNYAPITAFAICPANNDYWERRNCLLKVGGIAGLSWEGLSINSCSNRGAINVNYDGSWEKTQRNMSAVGGIIGKQGYGLSNAEVTFSSNHGPITVTGNGHLTVGGITGASGAMRGCRVYDTASINVSCKAGFVGGLLGFADGNSQYQHVRTSYCEADITAENIWNTDRYKVCVGGLIGYFATGATGNNPSLVPYSSDPQRCHYTGNVVSTGQVKVGMVIGWIGGNNEKVFGTSETPILVSGTIHRWGYDADNAMNEPLTINASNVEDFAIGSTVGTVTIFVAAD